MKQLLSNILLKLIAIPLRAVDIGRYFPTRLSRVLQHFHRGLQYQKEALQAGMTSKMLGGHVFKWWGELLLLFLDLLGLAEGYETLNDLVKFNSRPLRKTEEHLARKIFGTSINYSRVRIDKYAFLGPRQYKICYVSFYLINSWGEMSKSILIHELVHVWQYQRLGILYIPRALGAQQTTEGYNYGGVEALKLAINQGKQLLDFNLEQQADIITDYYRLSVNLPVQWGYASKQDLAIYKYFADQLLFAKPDD
jgi:hypothetical protein